MPRAVAWWHFPRGGESVPFACILQMRSAPELGPGSDKGRRPSWGPGDRGSEPDVTRSTEQLAFVRHLSCSGVAPGVTEETHLLLGGAVLKPARAGPNLLDRPLIVGNPGHIVAFMLS